MFNKYMLFFFASVATSIAAPLPKIDLTFQTPAPAASPVVAAAPVVQAAAAPAACNATALTGQISDMADNAQEVLAINFPFPDNIRATPADAATFDTVVTAIGDAGTAASSGGFATAASKISFIQTTMQALIGDKIQNGDLSDVANSVFQDANDASTLAAECSAPAAVAARDSLASLLDGLFASKA
ncbi:hypothetical protein C8R47DRAFT_1093678 [Mycena vitilis]|nr:hypothetical protein C8R47DRAFT_1093678 [Mycena vitilis]